MRSLYMGIFIGVIAAYIGSEIASYTAAIAMPSKLFEFLGIYAALLIWDSLVVQMPAFGISSFVLSYCVVKSLRLTWISTAVTAFVVSQLFIFILGGMEFPIFPPLKYFFPHYLVLALALGCGSYLGSKEQKYLES